MPVQIDKPRASSFFLLCIGAALLVACASPHISKPAYPVPDETSGAAVPPVHLELVGHDGVVLERAAVRDGKTRWEALCATPCRGHVPAFGRYRAAKDGSAGPPFTLPGPPGTSVTLKTDRDGRVWTRDSVELSAKRAESDASAALAVAWIATLFR